MVMSTRKIAVLVTGVGGGGIGEGVVKALKLVKEQYRIIGSDTAALSAPLFRVDRGYLTPDAAEEDYTDKLLNICKRENVYALIPGSVPELNRISKDRDIFEREDIVPILNPANVVEIGLDKWKTYKFLNENGFRCPQTVLAENKFDLVKKVNFPLIVKPRRSYGGRGVFLTQNVRELNFFITYLNSLGHEPIVQEYLGPKGQEYTTGVVISKEGKLAGSISMWRELKGGFSYRIIVDDFEDVQKNAEDVARRIGAKGAINIQSVLVDSELYTLEVNPRFSGTTPIRAACGFNEVDAVIQNFVFAEKIRPYICKKKTIVVRYLEEVYIDSKSFESMTTQGFADDQGRRLNYM